MRVSGAVGALLAVAALAPTSRPAAAGPAGAFVGEGVRQRLATDGRLRVLVARDPSAPGAPGLEVARALSGGRVLVGWLTPDGLEALRRDGATRAVVADRVVRPAGQVGTAHVGADQLLAAGLNGTGRAIAIVDTGVDPYHPDLGASASGSGRVVGGWNFADGNADAYDCDGHGTAVAGVAAGEQGIAPGATVVPLKVFGARDGCAGALASDVLAAVEWALERREELRIDVLNLSLSDDRARPGFCDAEDPVAAEVFARARSAGLAVVAASGNSGHPDALAWPACHSDVVSVGMVYSAAQGPTSWAGAADCTDAATGPDVVPCASNGSRGLSLLAPGVRWVVPTAGGGRKTTFSGTSAAAPAAAASLLLARQFSEARDPQLSADFLRLTGVPVSDPRTSSSTPRVDAGAALVSTSPFTGPCERAAGSSTVVCRAETSALAGRISSLAVALTLERPRREGLVATLSAPDGTTVRLLNGSPWPGPVFREVVGRTVASDEPLSLFSGRDAAGTWTLRLEDEREVAETRVVSWALAIEPEAPRPSVRPGAPSRLVPTVVRSAGLHGAFFETDLVLFNPDETARADVKLSFLPSGRSLEGAVDVRISLPPLATRVLSDVVGNAFRTSGFGPAHVEATGALLVTSRTESRSAGGGAYGLLVPDVGSDASVGSGSSPAWLAPAFRPGKTRVNVGFVEVAGQPADVELLVRDDRGAVKGRLSLSLGPFESYQVTDVHRAAAVSATAGDLFEVRVASGAGRVVSWATAVDNGSNDGLLVTASGLRRDSYLPASAHAPGRFGAYFRTDLKLSNPWSSPVNVRISFFPSKGPGPLQLVLSLGAWETRLFEDVLSSLFGASEDAAGALRLTVLGASPGIVVSSRTWAEDLDRSYGFAVGVLENAEAVAGEQIALTFLSSTDAVRTNVGFLETFGIRTALRFTLLGSDGARLASRDLVLDPYQAVQWNDVFSEVGAPPRADASAIVEVLDGGAVIAHVIRIDNRTNDASFVTGQVLRRSPAAPGSSR
jgi:hypothetical protein